MNLVTGPYNYEFGHELFSFQGRIRHLSKKYDKVLVCTSPEMRFLYEDFTNTFIPLANELDRSLYPNADFISQKDLGMKRLGIIIEGQQEFVKYGNKIDESYDILFHARAKGGMGGFNLQEATYDFLYKQLSDRYNIGFIGSKGSAYCPKSAEDLRGIELSYLADLMSSSRLTVGPSSGPMHFASLCGLPHVTWGGYELRTFLRYIHFWNPFSTTCYVLGNYNKSMTYLKNRASTFGCPLNVLEKGHVNLVQVENFHAPQKEELLLILEDILGG